MHSKIGTLTSFEILICHRGKMSIMVYRFDNGSFPPIDQFNAVSYCVSKKYYHLIRMIEKQPKRSSVPNQNYTPPMPFFGGSVADKKHPEGDFLFKVNNKNTRIC